MSELKKLTGMWHTIRDAIDDRVDCVVCTNGTRIDLPDVRDPYPVSPPKIINGKPVFRTIYCVILPNDRTKGMDVLKQKGYWTKGYGIFQKTDYIIPEKELNIFISQNGGLDIVRSFWTAF